MHLNCISCKVQNMCPILVTRATNLYLFLKQVINPSCVLPRGFVRLFLGPSPTLKSVHQCDCASSILTQITQPRVQALEFDCDFA